MPDFCSHLKVCKHGLEKGLWLFLVEKMLKSQREPAGIILAAAFWMALFSARQSPTGQPSRLEESVCGSHQNARQSWARWFSSLNDYRLLPDELTRFRKRLKSDGLAREAKGKGGSVMLSLQILMARLSVVIEVSEMHGEGLRMRFSWTELKLLTGRQLPTVQRDTMYFSMTAKKLAQNKFSSPGNNRHRYIIHTGNIMDVNVWVRKCKGKGRG